VPVSLVTASRVPIIASLAMVTVTPGSTAAAQVETAPLAGFMINELPAIGLCWLLASTALAWSEGDLATPVGAAPRWRSPS
jgi:hypothetical protein